MAPGGEGIGFCIDSIVSNVKFADVCNSRNDCMGHSSSF